MTYHLGIDLGTTYTAAATHEAGRIEVVPLGDRGPSIPSVLYMRPDGNIVAGDAANRHSVSEPERIAREFKRRLGDPTPIQLAGVATPPEVLTGHLLRWVYDTVVRAKGVAPLKVALTHPANWGPYKRDLLVRAAEAAGLADVTLATEPQAAAISYANQERVEPGEVIAVYDLGGGTFDAAILRKEGDGGFTILGTPEGIERLGGIDFDAAVFAHVSQSLEGVFDELDPEDEATVSAVARLRQECTAAKEALSLDSEAVIPVLLPTTQTEVRTTRAELEDMIRGPLMETVSAMERALRSASLEPAQVAHILLVGGSSRIPMVAQLVSSQLGRPVAVDAHPKHAIALGAAIVAARAGGVQVGDAHAATGPAPVTAPVPVIAASPAAPPAHGVAPSSPPAGMAPAAAASAPAHGTIPATPTSPPVGAPAYASDPAVAAVPAGAAPPAAAAAASTGPVDPAPGASVFGASSAAARPGGHIEVPAPGATPTATARPTPNLPPPPASPPAGYTPPAPAAPPAPASPAAGYSPPPAGPPSGGALSGQGPVAGSPGFDPTFDAVPNEVPPPSLGYRQASAPPPPGTSTDLPPGYLTHDQKDRVQRKQNRRGHLRIVVVLLVLVVAILATIALTNKKNAPKSLISLQEGQCFTGDANDLKVVACQQPHVGELFKIVPAADAKGAYPGEQKLIESGRLSCAQAFEAYSGATVEAASQNEIKVSPNVPTQAMWDDGNTSTYCTATSTTDGKLFPGTVRKAG